MQLNRHRQRPTFSTHDAGRRTCGMLLGLLLAWTAGGEGFRNPPPGTFNLGRSGSRITQIDDASAIHQNPANLVEVTGLELQLTPTVVNITSEFESPDGQTAETEDPWKLLPNIFLAAPLTKDRKWAAGFGITTPYGIGSSWDTDSSAFAPPTAVSAPGVFRYTAPYFAELKTINFNPGLAVKLGDHFQVGAGLDVMWTELTLKQFYPWARLPFSAGAPDGEAKAQGDGVGFGANLGVTWLITERQRLALTYRSPMSVDLDGDFEISNVTPIAAFLGATPESQFNSKMQFPTIVALGYGIEVSETVRLGVDFEWLQFSRFESLDLDLGNNTLLLPDPSIDENWKNTFTLGIGGDWRFAKHWVLRASYQYYESPVPDETFSPTIPDANQNVITVGLGFHTGGHSLEAAYGLDFYDTREITGNQTDEFNGKYDFTVHLFSFAYRYRF